MKKCFTSDADCIGFDCGLLSPKEKLNLCRREEIKDETELIYSIFDVIDNCSNDKKYIQEISSKLSYAAHTINVNMNEELAEVLRIIKSFSLLLYEYQDKIVMEYDIASLMCSFSSELKKWFNHNFLNNSNGDNEKVKLPSIIADMNTLEMALGVCMLPVAEEDFDDIFF